MRILVFGGSGWIGRRLVARLAADARNVVVAPSRGEADVAVRGAVRDAVLATEPDVVVNLAAAQAGSGDDAMRAVNASGAEAVAEATCAAIARPQLIHMSTDLVLDGRAPPYADEALPSPLSSYGATKAAGERGVLARRPDALVLRTSLVVCRDEPDRFTAQCLARLAAGGSVSLFVDEMRCALTRDALADAILGLVGREVHGRLNVAGSVRVSRWDLGLALLRRFGADDASLARCIPVGAAGHREPRPLDLTLDVRRAESLLGRRIPGAIEDLSARRP